MYGTSLACATVHSVWMSVVIIAPAGPYSPIMIGRCMLGWTISASKSVAALYGWTSYAI